MDNSIDNDGLHTLKEGDELVNDCIDKTAQLMEKWKNRLTLDNLRLSERYRKGEIHLIVHCRMIRSDCRLFDTNDFCAIYQYGDSIARRPTDSSFEHRPNDIKHARQLVDVGLSGAGNELDVSISSHANEQKMMLVDYVKFM